MGYTKQASKFLKEHGYEKVESIEIIRTPLSSKIDTLLNLITLGKFTEAKSKAEYDKLFHLAIIVETKQGHYMMEKNENIRLGAVKNITSQTERKYAIPKNTAVHQLLDRAQHLQGDHDYFTYSAFQNNCQSFVLSVLKGSHIASKELQDFVKQNPAKILEHLPVYTNKLANILTDLYSVIILRNRIHPNPQAFIFNRTTKSYRFIYLRNTSLKKKQNYGLLKINSKLPHHKTIHSITCSVKCL